MSILNITTDVVGQDGVFPRTVKIVTTDSLATVITAGYLNNVSSQGFTIYPTDVMNIIYAYNTFTHSGTFSIFVPTISAGIITLSPWFDNGSVVLPVTAGNFAIFNDSTGKIKDLGIAPSDPTKTEVASVSGSITANHVAQFSDTSGTVQDGGVLGTAAAKAASSNSFANLAAVSAATTGSVVTYADGNGSVTSLTSNFRAQLSSTFAGGSTSFSITDANATTGHIVVASIQVSTNSVSINKAQSGTGSIGILFSADPGAGTVVNYILVKAQ